VSDLTEEALVRGANAASASESLRTKANEAYAHLALVVRQLNATGYTGEHSSGDC
jgi:hypothetical protein